MVPGRIKAVVGLGNPGKRYENTRHNAGFRVVDAFLNNLKRSHTLKNRYGGIYSKASIASRNIHFLKPLNYMNLSGEAVAKLCKKERLTPEEILIVYDDIDLELGTIRIREKGGSGGHNGLNSVIQCLNSSNFPRLRIGIANENNIKDTVSYVLTDFKEEEIFKRVLDLSVEAIRICLYRGTHIAMNEFNSKNVKKEEKESET